MEAIFDSQSFGLGDLGQRPRGAFFGGPWMDQAKKRGAILGATFRVGFSLNPPLLALGAVACGSVASLEPRFAEFALHKRRPKSAPPWCAAGQVAGLGSTWHILNKIWLSPLLPDSTDSTGDV